MEIREFDADTFRLRAVLIEDVRIQDALPDEPRVKDLWLWFFGSREEDRWLAHGLSDDADADTAEVINNSIECFEMDALITYLGHEWEVIEPMPLDHANLQRSLISTLSNEELAELRVTPKSAIALRRVAEEEVSKADLGID